MSMSKCMWDADTSRCKKLKHTLRPINSHLYLFHVKHSMALYNIQGGERALPRRAGGPRGRCRPHLRRRLAAGGLEAGAASSSLALLASLAWLASLTNLVGLLAWLGWPQKRVS